jgi:hypothetical protein
MTRYRIYQKDADSPNEWIEISVQKFLELTEGRGAYKKGTALEAIKSSMKIRTNFSFFKLDNPRGFENLFNY